ncbi:MAG: class I SAM-dependent methyltransferase [Magnetovibrio sp.]|nr:class I SAM-dependent methyltransferase [Magnetovibrio sp.]
MSKNGTISTSSDKMPKHLKITQISPWVARWTSLIRPKGSVLDLAAGGGRHGRMLLERDHKVTFLDRTIEPLSDLEGTPNAQLIEADLEDGSPWPLDGQKFDAIIVVNYLHRPLFDDLLASLNPGGIFIYETFARGNEDYARPRNPNHLLRTGELLDLVSGKLQVIGYEHGLVTNADITGVKQRLCAVNDLAISDRDDQQPKPHTIMTL